MAIITVVPSSPCLANRNNNKASDRKRPLRRVSFDETKNVEYENRSWNRKQAKRAWFSPDDFKQMKDDCITVARTVYQSEKGIDEDDSYMNVILDVYCLCMEGVSEKSTKLPKDSKKLFKKTIRKWSSRTGLEKLCIPEIGNDKRHRRAELTDRLLAVQDNNLGKPDDERANLLREASLSITRASRLFAYHMASASRTDS